MYSSPIPRKRRIVAARRVGKQQSPQNLAPEQWMRQPSNDLCFSSDSDGSSTAHDMSNTSSSILDHFEVADGIELPLTTFHLLQSEQDPSLVPSLQIEVPSYGTNPSTPLICLEAPHVHESSLQKPLSPDSTTTTSLQPSLSTCQLGHVARELTISAPSNSQRKPAARLSQRCTRCWALRKKVFFRLS